MTQENTGEKVPEVTLAPSAEEQASVLSTELEQTKQQLRDAQEEAKTHQKNVSAKAEELRKRGDKDAEISSLTAKVDVLTTMIADIYDREGETEEVAPSRKRKSEDILRTLQYKGGQEQEKATRQVYMEKAQEADRLVKEAGLDMETSPELENALLFFQTGNADKGLKKVQEVVGKIKAEKKVEKPQETEEEKEARLEKKILEKHGLLQPEAGTPSGSGKTFKQTEQDYVDGKISTAEYRRAMEERKT